MCSLPDTSDTVFYSTNRMTTVVTARVLANGALQCKGLAGMQPCGQEFRQVRGMSGWGSHSRTVHFRMGQRESHGFKNSVHVLMRGGAVKSLSELLR